MTGECCNVTHLRRKRGECKRCVGGVITDLPGGDIPCPWCQPDAYPDGFPGVRGLRGQWLIPPDERSNS